MACLRTCTTAAHDEMCPHFPPFIIGARSERRTMEKLAEEIVDAVLEEIERSPEMDRTGLRRDRMVGKVKGLIETSPRVRVRVRRGVADGAGL